MAPDQPPVVDKPLDTAVLLLGARPATHAGVAMVPSQIAYLCVQLALLLPQTNRVRPVKDS